jgi:hypothetical protein
MEVPEIRRRIRTNGKDKLVERVKNKRTDYTPLEVTEIINEKRQQTGLDVFEIEFSKEFYTLEYAQGVALLLDDTFTVKESNESYTIVFHELDSIPARSELLNMNTHFGCMPVTWTPLGIFVDCVGYHMGFMPDLLVQIIAGTMNQNYKKDVTIREGIERHLTRY